MKISEQLVVVTGGARGLGTVIVFLSPWSRAVSGQNLLVDGGLVKN
jgi:3-oxoacyl-[acyl-carrier protein] reductase